MIWNYGYTMRSFVHHSKLIVCSTNFRFRFHGVYIREASDDNHWLAQKSFYYRTHICCIPTVWYVISHRFSGELHSSRCEPGSCRLSFGRCRTSGDVARSHCGRPSHSGYETTFPASMAKHPILVLLHLCRSPTYV